MPASGIPACPFCGDPVLGLAGQDLLLDTYLLQDEAEDRAVLAAGAFGDVHARCLLESPWGRFWSLRTRQNLTEVRGLAAAAEGPEAGALLNDGTGEVTVVGHDGMVWSLLPRAFQERSPATGGCLVPVHNDFNLRIQDLGPAAGDVLQLATTGGSYPLATLVTRLGAEAHLLDPDAIAGGVLEIGARESGVRESGVTADPRLSRIETRASYSQFLPTHVETLVAATLSTPDLRL
jgi:hypothetical protein